MRRQSASAHGAPVLHACEAKVTAAGCVCRRVHPATRMEGLLGLCKSCWLKDLADLERYQGTFVLKLPLAPAPIRIGKLCAQIGKADGAIDQPEF